MVKRITSKAFRSSCSQMFYKIVVLKNFAKFTGKPLCWSHFLNKAAGLKRLHHKCFHKIFPKFSRATYNIMPFIQ